MRHFLSCADLTRESAQATFSAAAELKQRWKAGGRGVPLAGRTLALIFEKPSLRTRVTFEVGVVQLGGRAVYLAGSEIGLGTREAVPDVARNLSRWVDGIVARVFAHATIAGLARHATIPVINALSDFEHPCQAVADFFTLWERGVDLARMRLAWIGDGNNVCASFIHAAAAFGFKLNIACPTIYHPDLVDLARAERTGAKIEMTEDARAAVAGADCVVTDTWVSMGDADGEAKMDALEPFQVDAKLMELAHPDAIFLHCLPAHRGEEVTDEVIDGPQSQVWDEAENRIHAQKAVLAWCLGGNT